MSDSLVSLVSPSPSPPPLFHCDYTDWSPSFSIIPSVYLLAFLVGCLGNGLVLWVYLDRAEGRRMRVGEKSQAEVNRFCCANIFRCSQQSINRPGRVQQKRQNCGQSSRPSSNSSTSSSCSPSMPRPSRSLTDSLIASLALADLCFLVTLPLWAVYTAMGYHWPFGQPLCQISSFLTALNMYASVFSLSMLSVERYWVLTGHRHSGHHAPRRCPSRALWILGGVWILAGVLALPGLLLRSVQEVELESESEDDWQLEPADSGSVFLSCQMDYSMLIGEVGEEADRERAEMWWTAALSLKSTLIGFLLPLVILLVCYCSLAQLLNRHFGRGPRPDRRRQRRLLRVIVTLVMAFFLCWLPLHVNKTVSMLLEFGFVPYSCSLDQILLAAHPYVTCLAYLNSCLNPLLYAACDSSFRKRCRGALLMLCRMSRRGPEGEGERKKDEGQGEKEERSSAFPTRTQEETGDRTEEEMVAESPACKIEVPERLTVSHAALVESGLADRCVSVPVREATDEDILLVHSEEYLEAVKKTPYMTLEELQEFTLQYGDVYFHPNIYHCAKLAAGAALQLVDSVITGKVRNGMALVRPPGHHSMRSAASGFCVFNNVAIAARYAKQKYGVKRVLIVDWDIHHGQGVQYCFEDDPSVLYFSWHRYEHQEFWPQLRESDFDSVGKENGAGFNINVPWNKVGMQNSDYLSVFCHLLLPVAYEFCPDLVLVCAGFDSAIGDPEGEMCATPDVFAHLTHLLMNLAGGKLCAVLEGGYNLTSLPQSVCQTVHTLLGDPAPRPENLDGPCRSALESLQCVRSAHRRFWSCLKHAADLPTSDISTKRIKLAEEEEKSLDKAEGEGEKSAESEEKVWPEPPKRLTPAVRTAAVLPDGVACPDGCKPFGSSGDLHPPVLNTLKEKFLKDAEDSAALSALSSLIGLVEKMDKNEGLSEVSGLIQAFLGLLLPLGYEYDPSLVLLVRMSNTGLSESVWLQLTCLLQGLAQGHTLVLLQEGEEACVGPTASSLLGSPAPSLGQLSAPLPEDVESVESLRHRLKADWKLLQTTAQETGGGDEH
ncbi:hypothetical protein INR49_024969 [Caranx melampygus]|nr:hypothetical protein INR49_024969 [Caranx melampygus]